MRKARRPYVSVNGMTPSDNRALGRGVWSMFMLLMLYVAYRLRGPQFFLEPETDLVLAILGAASYRLTGWLLRTLRIWKY